MRTLFAALAAAAVATAVGASRHARETHSRKLSQMDPHGGELHVTYEALPRSGVVVLDELEGVSPSCSQGTIALHLAAGQDGSLVKHVTELDHDVYLASSTPLTGCGGVFDSAPWYARVASTSSVTPATAEVDGTIVLNVNQVNATDLFEHGTCKTPCGAALCCLKACGRADRAASLCLLWRVCSDVHRFHGCLCNAVPCCDVLRGRIPAFVPFLERLLSLNMHETPVPHLAHPLTSQLAFPSATTLLRSLWTTPTHTTVGVPLLGAWMAR